MHSRYVRRRADTAIGGQTTAIDLEVRRFFCDNGDCGKTTFAEQVEGLTFRYGRRTVLLQQALEQVTSALGGKAGERLATRLSMPISGSTLLRLIRRLKLPPVPEVEVLGVDEFAFRRGRRFGTILIDLAIRRPVDVLPDHTADTFADWLQGREHVQTICRDRGGSFAEGTQRALPGVPQVADRWHILHNLATAVERALRRHRACLQPPAPQPEPDEPGEAPAEAAQPEGRRVHTTRARWQQIRPLGAGRTRPELLQPPRLRALPQIMPWTCTIGDPPPQHVLPGPGRQGLRAADRVDRGRIRQVTVVTAAVRRR